MSQFCVAPIRGRCQILPGYLQSQLNTRPEKFISFEIGNEIDLTGAQQHGHKETRGTATIDLILQSMIAAAITDERVYSAW